MGRLVGGGAATTAAMSARSSPGRRHQLRRCGMRILVGKSSCQRQWPQKRNSKFFRSTSSDSLSGVIPLSCFKTMIHTRPQFQIMENTLKRRTGHLFWLSYLLHVVSTEKEVHTRLWKIVIGNYGLRRCIRAGGGVLPSCFPPASDCGCTAPFSLDSQRMMHFSAHSRCPLVLLPDGAAACPASRSAWRKARISDPKSDLASYLCRATIA